RSSHDAFKQYLGGSRSEFAKPVGFAAIRSNADLMRIIRQMLEVAQDPYSSLTSEDPYNTSVVVRSGKVIGVECEVSYSEDENSGFQFKLSPRKLPDGIQSTSGIEDGDILIKVNGVDIE